MLRKIGRTQGWCDFLSYKYKSLFWDLYYRRLRNPKFKLDSVGELQIETAIIENELKRNDFDVKPFWIDKGDYISYLKTARYERFRDYQRGGKAANFAEKSLEHYIAAKLLTLSSEDVFIDIACSNSPAALIYHELYRCQVYRQDLIFQKGIHGNTIGGNAAEMPVPAGFASKMALHCSFEHFEHASDIGFIKEANRVLRSQGLLCIIPFYLSTNYIILTDPACLPKNEVHFENDAMLCCVKG